MKKTLAAIIGTIALVLIIFLIFVSGNTGQQASVDQAANNNNQNPSQDSSSNQGQNKLDPNNYTRGANIGDTVDATGQSEVSIVIDDFIFQTTFLKISPGTTVTWTNQGNVRHNVVSGTNSPNSGLNSELLRNGDSYSFRFDQPGTYEYVCTPHPTQMRAVVTVE